MSKKSKKNELFSAKVNMIYLFFPSAWIIAHLCHHSRNDTTLEVRARCGEDEVVGMPCHLLDLWNGPDKRGRVRQRVEPGTALANSRSACWAKA